ncbi:MAG: nucleoside permease [Planctomycetota bacterium]
MANPPSKSDTPAGQIGTRAAEVGIAPLDLGVRAKLSIMMFLQYFTWGAFFVTLGTYLGGLGFSGQRIGLAYGTSALGAIIAPFFVGMIADRFFATQHILTVLHLLGAVLLFLVSRVTEFSAFYPLMLLYFICYMPTLALTNSLAFSVMTSPEKQFPGIRVLGTIGWIAAGLAVGYLQWENVNTALQLAAVSSAVLGLYCLSLPNTPPPNKGRKVTIREVLGFDALSLMKQWPFAVFVIGSFLVCIPLQFYYAFTNQFLNDIGVTNAAGKMTIGQMSEIFFMLVMPIFFVRLGVKYMLIVGMLAWAIRYVLFSFGNATDGMWMLYIGIALHGICYDFFFVTGYIYVDKKAPESIRASAQGFITLVTLGFGGFIGTYLAGFTGDYYKLDGKVNWHDFWLVPAAASAVVLVLFAVTFFDHVDKEPTGH